LHGSCAASSDGGENIPMDPAAMLAGSCIMTVAVGLVAMHSQRRLLLTAQAALRCMEQYITHCWSFDDVSLRGNLY